MKIAFFSTLRAVLQHGTFAAAAEKLSLSPSAVSMQMKQLESFFGHALFDRSGVRPVPTALAWKVAGLMTATLEEIEALRKGTTLQIEGTLDVGMLEMVQPVLLPRTLQWLRQHHPRLELRLARGRSSSLTSAVKASRLDAAVVARPAKGGHANVTWAPLFERKLTLIAPPDTLPAPAAELFQRYAWIRYDRNTISGTMAARYVSQQIGDVRSSLELASPTGILALVSAGLGISVVPQVDATMLQCYPVRVMALGPDAPSLQVALVTRKLDADNRLLQALHQALRHATQAASL